MISNNEFPETQKADGSGLGSVVFWAVGYVLIFIAIQWLSQSVTLFVSSFVSGAPLGQLDAVGTIVSMVVFSVSAIALFTLARWSPASRSYLVSRPWDVLLWSAVASLGAIAPSLFVQEHIPSWSPAIQEYVDKMEALAAQMMSTRGGYAVVCLLAPVAEEVVFRGAVLRTLLGWRSGAAASDGRLRWAMIALSAFLFAAAHVNPAQMIHPFAVGLLLGWMYARTRSIVPGIAYHWANNTAAYILFHLYPDPSITLSQIFGSHERALMAVFFSLLIICPAIYQLNLRMRPARAAED